MKKRMGRSVFLTTILCFLTIAPVAYSVTIGEAEFSFNFPWGNP